MPLPDVPFYDRWGTIPNDHGRVLKKHEGDERLTGNYVVGWIKRGPSGLIGTNKPDAIESANRFLEDLKAQQVLDPHDTRCETIFDLVKTRKPTFCTFEDWEQLDAIEKQRGAEFGRSRVKFTSVEEMLIALGKTEALVTSADKI